MAIDMGHSLCLSRVLITACEAEWEVVAAKGTLGGEFQDATSLQECLDLCLADPECVAADFGNQAPFFCFLHSNRSLNENEDYFNPFIFQHVLKSRCDEGKRKGLRFDVTFWYYQFKAITGIMCQIMVII